MKHFVITLLFVTIFSTAFSQQFIFDEGNILSLGQKDIILSRLKQIKAEKGVDIRCLIPNFLQGKSPDKFTLEKGNSLGVGTIGINNGIIIMVAPKEEQLYIAASYGVHWQLTDQEINRMIDDLLGPFKGKHYANGILRCLDQIEKELAGINFNVSEANLKTTDFSKLVGKIVAFDYSSYSPKANFKIPSSADPQFDPNYKTILNSDGKKRADLYYDKYMGDMVAELLAAKKILVFARVKNYAPLQLELIGTMKF